MKRLFLLSCASIAVALFTVAPAAQGKGTDVTFVNRTGETAYVLAVFGADAACDEQPNQEQLELDPYESRVLESGDSKVCWCFGTTGKIGQCKPGLKAKPGQKIRLSLTP